MTNCLTKFSKVSVRMQTLKANALAAISPDATGKVATGYFDEKAFDNVLLDIFTTNKVGATMIWEGNILKIYDDLIELTPSYLSLPMSNVFIYNFVKYGDEVRVLYYPHPTQLDSFVFQGLVDLICSFYALNRLKIEFGDDVLSDLLFDPA